MMIRKIFIFMLLSAICLNGAPLKRVCKNGVCKMMADTPAEPEVEVNAPIYRLDKVGVFFGMHGGFGVGSLNDNKSSIPQNSIEPYAGVRLGYNYYFLNYLGIRVYGTYDIDINYFITNNSTNPTAHRFLFNGDVIYDMYSTTKTILGVFAGFGLGYGFQDNDKGKVYSAFLIPINLGISFTINQKHKIDLFSRISLFSNPVYYTTNHMQNSRDYEQRDFKSTMLGIGYSYIFN